MHWSYPLSYFSIYFLFDLYTLQNTDLSRTLLKKISSPFLSWFCSLLLDWQIPSQCRFPGFSSFYSVHLCPAPLPRSEASHCLRSRHTVSISWPWKLPPPQHSHSQGPGSCGGGGGWGGGWCQQQTKQMQIFILPELPSPFWGITVSPVPSFFYHCNFASVPLLGCPLLFKRPNVTPRPRASSPKKSFLRSHLCDNSLSLQALGLLCSTLHNEFLCTILHR